jgi:hypothetical protein
MSQGAVNLEKVASPKKRVNKYESLYKLQYKACQIMKGKCPKEDRRANINKSIQIHTRIL